MGLNNIGSLLKVWSIIKGLLIFTINFVPVHGLQRRANDLNFQNYSLGPAHDLDLRPQEYGTVVTEAG
jgi:hypothetical protein